MWKAKKQCFQLFATETGLSIAERPNFTKILTNEVVMKSMLEFGDTYLSSGQG